MKRLSRSRSTPEENLTYCGLKRLPSWLAAAPTRIKGMEKLKENSRTLLKLFPLLSNLTAKGVRKAAWMGQKEAANPRITMETMFSSKAGFSLESVKSVIMNFIWKPSSLFGTWNG
jgi:hypothetical protein